MLELKAESGGHLPVVGRFVSVNHIVSNLCSEAPGGIGTRKPLESGSKGGVEVRLTVRRRSAKSASNEVYPLIGKREGIVHLPTVEEEVVPVNRHPAEIPSPTDTVGVVVRQPCTENEVCASVVDGLDAGVKVPLPRTTLIGRDLGLCRGGSSQRNDSSQNQRKE